MTVLGPQNYQKMHLKAMDQYLDFWNLMAYDFAGSWDSCAGHQSNLHPSTSNPASTPFSTLKAVEYYKSQGIEGSKLIIGMPLYGRAFASTDGPGSHFSGTGEGSWEQGVWDFKALPQKGAKENVCNEVAASWSYDPEKRLMVSYDTKEIAERKASFIKNEGLGGAMWWESSADKQGDESLIGTVGTSNQAQKLFLTLYRLFTVCTISTVATTRFRIQNQSMTIYEMDFRTSSSSKKIVIEDHAQLRITNHET